MNGISHKQAVQFIHQHLDGMLQPDQRSLLDAHLRSCNSCQNYFHEMDSLPSLLQHEFHSRWDANNGPSERLTNEIHRRTRKVIMSKRINLALNTFGGVVALAALFFVVTSVISRFQDKSTPSSGVQAEVPLPPSTKERLIAFTATAENGNLDIFTMHPDGSGLTNLTNNPAQDVSPVWSPDGSRIAFESDRNGFRQIFVMNADGSNVAQLTGEKTDQATKPDQWIGEPYNLGLNLWSPDGNRLIFSEIVPGEEKGMLYVVEASGKNKKPLFPEAGKYSSPSWSPDGKHIAVIALENNVTRIYSADADGNNLTNVTGALPAEETLYPVSYSWSRDAQSIFFVASNLPSDGSFSFGSDGGNPYYWKAYEASLDGNTLVTNATTRSQIGGYWDGTYFLAGSIPLASPAFTWVQEKGATTTFNPIRNCEDLLDESTGGYTTGYSSYKQSANGNVVIGAYCPNGDKWLYWANSKGAVRPLLSTPMHIEGTTVNAMEIWAPPDFAWSADDKYVAFNLFSQGKADLYIVNVAEALKDPSSQPVRTTIGDDSLYYTPSWRPTP